MKQVPAANPGHESSDPSLRLVGIIAAVLALGVATVLLVSYGIFTAGESSRSLAPGLGRQGVFQNGPETRTGIEQDWIELDAETRRNLYTYGWVDRPSGVVRIPVQRAMDLMAEKRP